MDLNSDTFAPLSELAGEAIEGNWTLHVSDLLKDDVGRLDKWGVTIEYEPGEQIFTGEGKYPKTFETETELINYVAREKDAVGYISSPPGNRVKVITISDSVN